MTFASPRLSRALLAVVLVVSYAVAALATSGPASAAGTLTIVVEGQGFVLGPGINCDESGGPGCSASYGDDVTQVELTADKGTPNGYTFSEFSANCVPTTSWTCTVPVNGTVTVTARYRDIEKPKVAITAPQPDEWVGKTVEVAADATDNSGIIDGVAFHVNNRMDEVIDTTAPYGGTLTVPGFEGATATITAQAFDGVGSLEEASVTIRVDQSAPSLSILSEPGRLVRSGSPAWTFSASDGGSGLAAVACSLRPANQADSFGPCSGGSTGHAVTGLADGSYVFTVRATDQVGNTVTAVRQLTVDTTAPVVMLATHPKSTVKTTRKKAKVDFVFASENGASFRCSLDGAAYTPCAMWVTLMSKVGKHTLSVEALDVAGNVSVPATTAWKVRRVPKRR